MKITLALVVLVIAALLFVLIRRGAHPNAPRTFKTTDEFIQWLADGAVQDADVNQHIKLDYTPESVRKVETILGNLHDLYVKQPSSISVRGLSAAYGAYIGEVIRRTETGVHWERDNPVFGEKSYPLHWGKNQSNPLGWCYERIVNGEEDNVWVKYSILTQHKGDLHSLIGK